MTCIITVPLYFAIKYVNIKYFHINWLTIRKLKLLTGFLTIMIASYHTYTAFYPSDSFFEDEFENSTKMQFPNSGKILEKEASYPDMHGDYTSSAIILVNDSDFNLILKQIQQNKTFQPDTLNISFGREIQKKVNLLTNADFKMVYSNYELAHQLSSMFVIAFDFKNKIIIFEWSSW